MAIGLPAGYTFLYKTGYGSYTKLLDDIRDAVRSIGWKNISEQPGVIQAATGIGLRSYGENITISILQDNSILIESKCTVPIQVYDWGKNRDNVMRFLGALVKAGD